MNRTPNNFLRLRYCSYENSNTRIRRKQQYTDSEKQQYPTWQHIGEERKQRYLRLRGFSKRGGVARARYWWCNDSRKSASHICAIPQKDQLQLRLLGVVNKVQIYPVNTRCGTHHIPAHITQSIKLGHHNLSHLNP